VRIRRSALEAFIAAGETGTATEIAPADHLKPSEEGPRGLPAESRDRLAAALADSGDALASEDRDQLARALSDLADAARELAAELHNTRSD
jgi:hypothetical protein